MSTVFATGDRVQCKASNRRNGVVRYIYCNKCENCIGKKWSLCSAEQDKKDWACASFTDSITSGSRSYRYEFNELTLEEPLPLKVEEREYDWSARDIRPWGVALLDIPLIVADDEPEETISEKEAEAEPQNTNPTDKIVVGMFYDTFTGISSTMERPI